MNSQGAEARVFTPARMADLNLFMGETLCAGRDFDFPASTTCCSTLLNLNHNVKNFIVFKTQAWLALFFGSSCQMISCTL